MGFDKDFKPILRFLVVSDIHYQDEETVERERMRKALTTAYELSDSQEYSKLDALFVVGDFATRGTEPQMLAFKETLDAHLRENLCQNTRYSRCNQRISFYQRFLHGRLSF